jgi:hypothetical protein
MHIPLSPSIELVWTLIHAYPTLISLEDNDGTSALEHAIISEAPIEMVKALQHATAFVEERGAKRSQEPSKYSLK